MRRSWKRYQDLALKIKRIHRAVKVTVIPIVIGALETICKSLVWEVDCLTFLEVHSCQSFFVLLISCRKCCVSKLREAAETWLRIPRKHQRPGVENTIIILTIIIILMIGTVFI